MAYVIGPNGRKNHVPDDIAPSLVGDGKRGWSYAPEPEPEPEPKRTPRRVSKPAE